MLIRCINATPLLLTRNKIYKVVKEDSCYYYLKDDDGRISLNGGFYKIRFEVVEDIQVGDILTVREDLQREMDVIVPNMMPYAGVDITVRKIEKKSFEDYARYYAEGMKYFWLLDNFEQTTGTIIEMTIDDVNIFESFNM